MWYKGESPYALLPLGIFIEDGRKVARSPYGASWGGFVAGGKLKLKYALNLVDSLMEYLVQLGIEECYITMPPPCYYNEYTNFFEFALTTHGFSPENREITHVVSLPMKEADVWTCLDSKSRNQARKGLKLFEIQQNVEAEKFYPILLEDKMRHGEALPTHSLNDLKYLQGHESKFISFDIGIDEKGAKAGICYFHANGSCLTVFYMAQENKALGLNGMNALVLHGMQRAVREGYRYFDFGCSSYHTRIQNIGLAEFKEGFGASGMFRDTYCCSLNSD